MSIAIYELKDWPIRRRLFSTKYEKFYFVQIY
jgi:hypothetical protein